MHLQMWKRLEKVGQSSSLRREQVISVVQKIGETDRDVEDRIDRWKAGDVDSGIPGEYKGGELLIIRRRIVLVRKRRLPDD